MASSSTTVSSSGALPIKIEHAALSALPEPIIAASLVIAAPNALQVFHELIGDKPEIKVVGTAAIAGAAEAAPWTATLIVVDPSDAADPAPRVFQASHSTNSEAKRAVAQQYLDAFVPNWAEARINKSSLLPPPAVTERTADQALYEIEARGGCSVVHPHIDGLFFVGRAQYQAHHFEEKVPVAKDHSACKKHVALKLIAKLAKAKHALAEIFLQHLNPSHFIRGRLMPMEEGAEAEFKGQELEHGCLQESSMHWSPPKLKDVLRNVCAFFNSAGGSLWYGVHDSGLVQGMTFSSEARDSIERKIRTAISYSLQPLSWDYIAIRWHQIEDDPSILLAPPSLTSAAASSAVPSKAASSKASELGAPPSMVPPQDELLRASKAVQQRLHFLEQRFHHESRPRQLCILEVSILPSRLAHFWDNYAYYRNGNQTVVMPIPMLKQKIRAEPEVSVGSQ